MKHDHNNDPTELLIWGLRFWWSKRANSVIRDIVKDHVRALRLRKTNHHANN